MSMRRYCSSSTSDSSVLQYITEKPCPTAKSSTPRAIVVKNGFEMSETTRAMVLVRLERSWRASALGTYPSSSIAASTRARVRTLVWPVPLRTLETVIADTPARLATSLIVLIGRGGTTVGRAADGRGGSGADRAAASPRQVN